MSAVYVETSAFLAWLFDESEGSDVSTEVEAAETIVTSSLTFLESERVLVRAVSSRLLLEADAQRLRGAILRQRGTWIVMAISEEVLERAGRPFPVEPVRSLDAVHLATALVFARAFPEIRMLTLDRKVAENAAALALG